MPASRTTALPGSALFISLLYLFRSLARFAMVPDRGCRADHHLRETIPHPCIHPATRRRSPR
ncbi:MAG TPA: hypothetical protein VIR34_12030 [Gemmatimonadaceae bacterium]